MGCDLIAIHRFGEIRMTADAYSDSSVLEINTGEFSPAVRIELAGFNDRLFGPSLVTEKRRQHDPQFLLHE